MDPIIRSAFYFGHVDRYGNQPERPKEKYPYTYSPFVVYRNGENGEIQDGMHSDRMRQWDLDKFEKLVKKYFNGNQFFGSKPPFQIEAFLREYTGRQDLNLILIEQMAHMANGNDIWYFGLSYATPTPTKS